MPDTKVCPGCQAELPGDAPDGLCPQCLLVHGVTTAPGAPVQGKDSGTPLSLRPFTPPAPTELAPHFPQLEILELLGQGGMGAVYKAKQPGLDRLVALKILPPEAGRDPAFAERFTREARALAKLGHAHIVTVYDFGKADEYYYFLMEYVDGANLRQVIRSGQLLPAEALRIVPQICDALQFAHEEGIVHRDIKPENILLDKKGRVKIADFGIAKLLGRNTVNYTLTGPWQVMGTLHYMAPEQMDNPLGVDHRADIYSLGVVFYEMLTRQLPLGRFAPPSQKVQVDGRVDTVVLRALESDPNLRYQHASEIKTDVEGIRSGTAPTLTYPAAGELATWEPDFERIRRKVMVPAIGLLMSAILSLLPLAAIPFLLFSGDSLSRWGAAACGLSGLIGATIVLGVIKMTRLQWLPLALTCSILAMLPFATGCFLGMPIGLWAFVVLRNPEVVAAFQRKRWNQPTAPFTTATPTAPSRQTPAGTAPRVTPTRAAPATMDWVPPPTAKPKTDPPLVEPVPVLQFAGRSGTDLSRQRQLVELARKQVQGPAIALGILGCLGLTVLQIRPLTELLQSASSIEMGGNPGAIRVVASVFMLMAAWRLLRLRSPSFVKASAVVALIPGLSPWWLAGIPVGIWVLATLRKPDIKRAFLIKRIMLPKMDD
jgi:tRNA A-37 threonylcarbamoyl transferase component Bud32